MIPYLSTYDKSYCLTRQRLAIWQFSILCKYVQSYVATISLEKVANSHSMCTVRLFFVLYKISYYDPINGGGGGGYRLNYEISQFFDAFYFNKLSSETTKRKA